MKIYYVYFSPTGTSASIAGSVAAGIADVMGGDVVAVDVTHEAKDLNAGKDDIVVLAAPVYGGHMPPLAVERMIRISGDGTPCVLLSVYGNRAFEQSLCDMASFAVNKGFMVIAGAAFVGEHSYSTAETPIAVGRPDREDLGSAKNFGKMVAEKISSGTADSVDVSVLHDLPVSEESLVGFREFVIGYQQRQKESPKKILPEVDFSKCTTCGRCVSACPVSAISSDCITVDRSLCIKCCACVKVCPENARKLKSPFAPMLSKYFNIRNKAVFVL